MGILQHCHLLRIQDFMNLRLILLKENKKREVRFVFYPISMAVWRLLEVACILESMELRRISAPGQICSRVPWRFLHRPISVSRCCRIMCCCCMCTILLVRGWWLLSRNVRILHLVHQQCVLSRGLDRSVERMIRM